MIIFLFFILHTDIRTWRLKNATLPNSILLGARSVFPSGYNLCQKLDCQPPGGKGQMRPHFAPLVAPHIMLRALQLFRKCPESSLPCINWLFKGYQASLCSWVFSWVPHETTGILGTGKFPPFPQCCPTHVQHLENSK